MNWKKDLSLLKIALKHNQKKIMIFFVVIISILIPCIYFINKNKTFIVDNLMGFNKTNKSILLNNGLSEDDLSEFIKQYSLAHKGVYSVSMIELSGRLRQASYNKTRVFTSASTYKLFVAYSTLKRVEDGSWKWTDNILPDIDLSTCFDAMISKSDNECAEALIEKIGYRIATSEAYSIGCKNTTFISLDGLAKTTASDLALFLVKLHKGQILKEQSSRDRLMKAMKNNIHREGIPAGVNSLLIDKPGQINSFINDAAIIYSPTGIYVLVIMSDGSSWKDMADFAKNIDKIRTVGF